MPSTIHATLKKDFAEWKIKEANKIDNVKNGLSYEAEIENRKETFDVLFTSDGKVISKTKVENAKRD